MSPERILGSPPDGRSDVFSLGVVLHQLASGHHPFLKDTLWQTMAAILRDQPASTEGDLDVVPGFGRLVHRMLAKACAERFQTMGEVRGALEALRNSSASGTPRSGSNGAIRERSTRRLSAEGNYPVILSGLSVVTRAACDLYMGRPVAAIDRLMRLLPAPYPVYEFRDRANLMAVHAWTEHDDEVRQIWRGISASVMSASPDHDHVNAIHASFSAATALALVGEQSACGALYAILEPLPALGNVSPSTPRRPGTHWATSAP